MDLFLKHKQYKTVIVGQYKGLVLCFSAWNFLSQSFKQQGILLPSTSVKHLQLQYRSPDTADENRIRYWSLCRQDGTKPAMTLLTLTLHDQVN